VNLGLIAAEEHDFPSAIKIKAGPSKIQRQLAPDSMTVASSLINLGEIAFARGDLAAAQDYQSRALGIQEKAAPDSLEVSYSLTALGKVLWHRTIFARRGTITLAPWQSVNAWRPIRWNLLRL